MRGLKEIWYMRVHEVSNRERLWVGVEEQQLRRRPYFRVSGTCALNLSLTYVA